MYKYIFFLLLSSAIFTVIASVKEAEDFSIRQMLKSGFVLHSPPPIPPFSLPPPQLMIMIMFSTEALPYSTTEM